ncbi:MAG TPA: DUF885 family protein, partial [bacterium]|nr:DUF885 family protein [bacterium]
MAAFTGWLDDFFAVYYRHRPVNATFAGVHDYDDRLPDYSARGVDETVAAMGALLARLRSLPHEPLTEDEEPDRRLAEGFLTIQRWEFQSSHFHRGNPCVYTGEAVFGVIALFLRPFAPLADRIERAAARLSAVPALLDQGRQNVREAPAAWIDRAARECAGARLLLGEGIDLLLRG